MLLQGQRFVVTGIASKLSIAWAIAEALHREGASLILTYPNDKIKKRVDMAAEQFEADLVLECDVASDDSIAACFEQVNAHWGDGIDGDAAGRPLVGQRLGESADPRLRGRGHGEPRLRHVQRADGLPQQGDRSRARTARRFPTRPSQPAKSEPRWRKLRAC